MTQRRRILFIIPTLAAGGAERVIVTLLNHLDRAKFQMILAVLDTRGAAFLDDIPSDVQLLDLKTPRVKHALPKLVRLIWNQRADVVFSTLSHLNLALSMVRPLLPGNTQYVARETVVVSEHFRALHHSRAWNLAYRKFYSRFDDIICQSSDMRDDLLRNFAIPAQKLCIINNPIDIEKIARLSAGPSSFDFDSNSYFSGSGLINMVAAGRLTVQKGFDLLIDAVSLVGCDRLRVTVLGDGPLRGALDEQVRSRKVDHQVRFIGFQKNPYAFMARADAFILCSRYEGFPNVMLEALACGTRVISTPALGGTAEIARSTAGVRLAAAITAEALGMELLRFVEASAFHEEIDVRRFEVSKITAEYERVLMGNSISPLAAEDE